MSTELSNTNKKKDFKFDFNSSKNQFVRCYDEKNLDNINAALLTAEKCLESSSIQSKVVPKKNNKRLLLHLKKVTTITDARSTNTRETRGMSKNSNKSGQKKEPLYYISNRFEADDADDADETDSLNYTEHDDDKSNDNYSNSTLSDITHRLMNIDNQSLSEDDSVILRDTATIMIPSISNKKLDPLYSFMISNDQIRNFILSGQIMEHNDSIDDAYDPTEIDEIVDHEIINSVRYYLVKWKNWSKGFETWERFSTLSKATKLIFKYESKGNSKDLENPKSINGIHLMLSKNIISNVFELCKTDNGLSLPLISIEELFALSIDLELCTKVTRANRMKFLRLQLAVIALNYYRQEQLNEFTQWEIDYNMRRTNSVNIKIENNIDLERAPLSFAYTPKYVPRCGIIISDDPPIGCDCARNCVSSEDCCNEMAGFSSVYDSKKNITIEPGYPVFECNKKCKCSSACTNRVVQLGSSVNVSIYKTKNCGWGIKTKSNIRKGQFVGNYVGEIITVEESERRLENNSSRIDLMWNLDFDDAQDYKYTIDGTHYANFTYFINHSCDANLNVYAVWIDCLDRNLPQLALFANRDIFSGEQLTTNYFQRCSPDDLKKSGIKCKCNMKNCKGYYF